MNRIVRLGDPRVKKSAEELLRLMHPEEQARQILRNRAVPLLVYRDICFSANIFVSLRPLKWFMPHLHGGDACLGCKLYRWVLAMDDTDSFAWRTDAYHVWETCPDLPWAVASWLTRYVRHHGARRYGASPVSWLF